MWGTVRAQAYLSKSETLETARLNLAALSMTPSEARRHGIKVNRDGSRRNAHDLLSGYGMRFRDLTAIWPELERLPDNIVEQIECEAHYRGYLARQDSDIRAFRRDEGLSIPADFDFHKVDGLSNEQREKLAVVQPATIGAAARVPGVTPAAINLLLIHVRRAGVDIGMLPKIA